MGDKTAARRAAVECGVSIVPGTNQPLSSPDEAKAFAAQYGYPVILKAAMGGGGRGMRVVRHGERGRAGGCKVEPGRRWEHRKQGPGQGIAWSKCRGRTRGNGVNWRRGRAHAAGQERRMQSQ